jgi:hypothetical protein
MAHLLHGCPLEPQGSHARCCLSPSQLNFEVLFILVLMLGLTLETKSQQANDSHTPTSKFEERINTTDAQLKEIEVELKNFELALRKKRT